MKSSRMTALAVVLLAVGALAQETPEWAVRDYAAPPSHVFAAALRSIQTQKHEVKAKDDRLYTVDFHVGITAWSWGYNMRLVVTPVGEEQSKVTVGVLKSGGKVFSWGSGKKEVRKILGGIDAELASLKLPSQAPAPVATKDPAEQMCTVAVTSEPAGADVELDGKFVGNTPAKLRLKPGDYVVTVRKQGYVVWERKVSAIPDNELTIRAELDKAE